MKNRFRINLGLVLIVAGLSTWLYYRSYQRSDDLSFVSQLRPENVRALKIERVGRPEIALEQRAGSWWMTAPLDIAANPTRVKVLVRLPAKTSFATFPVAEVERHKLGLDPPLATVVFDGLSIGIGRANPLNQRRYLLVGDTVHMITDTVGDLYSENLGSFVSRSLLPRDTQMKTIRLPRLTLDRVSEQKWQASDSRFTSEQATQLANAWRQTAAVVVEWLPRQEVASEQRVEVLFDDGRSIAFEIVPRDKDLLVIRRELSLFYRLPLSATKLLFGHPLPGHGENQTQSESGNI